jgi:hypothetical protein
MSEEDLTPAAPIQRPEIVDPHNVQAVFVDWFITGGTFEGVINVALGTIDHSMKKSNEEPARIVVASRLRLTRDFASRLHAVLGDVLGIPPPEGTEPPPPVMPPRNTIN